MYDNAFDITGLTGLSLDVRERGSVLDILPHLKIYHKKGAFQCT